MDASVRPANLASLLDGVSGATRFLSLDCFDTLIWRDVNRPRDVFAGLTAAGCGVDQRVWAEHMARRRAHLLDGRSEVTLAEIYRAMFPDAEDDALARYAAAELKLEAEHCLAFRPVVELIRAAKRRGLGVIVVSDTYLDERQLRGLIASVAGEEVAGLIDRVFCSSAYGVGKGGGLFSHVLKALGAQPRDLLHLGDNKDADVTAPQLLQIPCVHLRQFDETVERRLRLESASLAMLDPQACEAEPVLQPHRAALALCDEACDVAEHGLGYASVGPIMHGYADWLKNEVDALASGGARVHLLFLMRDGYLPMRVFQAMNPGDGYRTAAVEISRFTATACSLGDVNAIVRYLAPLSDSTSIATMAAQLLMTRDEARRFLRTHETPAARLEFIREATKPVVAARIARRSSAFAARMLAHLRMHAAIEPGDTLVLADLGYNGTVQSLIEPVLRQRLGVEVQGRYLLLREQDRPSPTKLGLLDRRRYDANALTALCAHVSVLEQLCTAAQGSVIDYEDDGAPVRKRSDIKGGQSEVRDRVQRGAIAFARHYAEGLGSRSRSNRSTANRHGVAASLSRLMFLPMAEELAVLEAFQHDVNMGTRETVPLFDAEIAARGLKSRGMFYLNNSKRMFLAGELRGQGLQFSLTWMAQRRFGLDLRYGDFQSRSIALPIMIADGQAISLATAPAYATHDGFMAANIPIGASKLSVGVLFGKPFTCVQIESVSFILAEQLLDEQEQGVSRHLAAAPVYEGMDEVASGVRGCSDASAFMMVPAPAPYEGKDLLLSVVFRPLAERAAEVAAPARAEEKKLLQMV